MVRPGHRRGAQLLLAAAVLGARELAHGMGIPHVTLDLRERFRSTVVDEFLDGYAAGRTPNPCVRCNGEVRFDAMLDLADALGAARLATGHYARIARDEHGPLLRAGADPRKDQSYMLARLEPAQLERLSFPLGGLTKDAVRALARAAGLSVADRRESQDLCFAAGLGSRGFLRRHGPAGLRRPGRSWTPTGASSAGTTASTGSPSASAAASAWPAPSRCTCSPRTPRTATVTVGPREALAVTRVRLERPQLHRGAAGVEAVRLRYGSAEIPCRVAEAADGALELELARPAQAVAPGQLACLLVGRPGHGLWDDRGGTVTPGQGADRPRRAARRPTSSRSIRLIIGGIAERVDFAFEEIDDLQLAVERLLAEAGARDTVHLRFEVGEEAIRTRVGPLDERAITHALRDGDSRPGQLTLERILETVVDSFGVEDVDGDGVMVRLEKRKAYT